MTAQDKPVKTLLMMVIGFIPFGWLYVFHRINKMKLGLAFFATFIIIPNVLQWYLPWLVGILVTFLILIPIELGIIRRYCNQYNRSLLQ